MSNPTHNLDQLLQTAVQYHYSGQLHEAEKLYRQILAQQPNQPDTLNLLGALASQVGHPDIAVNLIRQAISIKPAMPEALNNLGNVLNQLGQRPEAIDAYRQAIALKPDFAEAHYNLGNTLGELVHPDEAIAAYRQAIALQPGRPQIHNNLANALFSLAQFDEAIAVYRQALAIDPNQPQTHSNILFVLNYHPGVDPLDILAEARRWNQQHAEPLRHLIQPHLNPRDPNRRLRIGYVSSDFRDHVVGRNLLPLFDQHDHQQFEVICYSNVHRPDAITQRFQRYADQWHGIVNLSNEQLAAQVRNDKIDILVDLTMHMANSRLLLFARKPAPIQATFAAYPGTTGLSSMDYRLTDPYLDPPGMDESIYAEKTIRLPDAFWCYDPLEGRDVAVNALPASSNGYITFGCLNNYCKVGDAVLSLWADVLQAVPNSRLLLTAPVGSARERVLSFFEPRGIALQRIEFVPRVSREKYLELYHNIDIGLDTLPATGHTTSLDSYWMGVPVVTLVGHTVEGRAGFCQLKLLNLPDLIAETPEHYVQIAAALADNLPRLAELRSTLRQRMEQSPLMDAPRFARDMEAAYRQMWTRWCVGQSWRERG